MNATAATQPLRVVIVDDTPDLRDLLRLAMESGGFDVVAEAGDGAEAIEVARQYTPDVILLDLAMPVMDGLEALPTLRQLCPDAKIVVLSRGWTINTGGGPHFSDVPSTNAFYPYIETAYNRNVIAGYADGTFRWGSNATRAQLSKIIQSSIVNP